MCKNNLANSKCDLKSVPRTRSPANVHTHSHTLPVPTMFGRRLLSQSWVIQITEQQTE